MGRDLEGKLGTGMKVQRRELGFRWGVGRNDVCLFVDLIELSREVKRQKLPETEHIDEAQP